MVMKWQDSEESDLDICQHNVKRRLNAEIVEPDQTPIARQRLSKHIPAAKNTKATIKELLFLCNG
jgi:hypothetical protein